MSTWKTHPVKGIILGKVKSKSTQAPVVDALVTVTQTGKHRLSSADGTFTIMELRPGNFTLNVKKGEIGEITVDAAVEAGKVTRLDVAL